MNHTMKVTWYVFCLFVCLFLFCFVLYFFVLFCFVFGRKGIYYSVRDIDKVIVSVGIRTTDLLLMGRGTCITIVFYTIEHYLTCCD